MNRPISNIDNIWRHWWRGHMAAVGGTSRLLVDPLPAAPELDQGAEGGAAEGSPRSNRQQRRRAAHQRRRAPILEAPPPPPAQGAKGGARPEPNTANWQTPELADWAKNALADRRISENTFEDFLEGIDDYFEIFTNLRRVDREAYKYFSQVGAPIVLKHTRIRQSIIDRMIIPNATELPSFFGAFVTRTEAEYRDDIINDNPGLLDFEYYEKLSTAYPTAAPLGTTIFRHHLVSLGRGGLSKAELKKYPGFTKGNSWGAWWLIGVLPDGSIKALPCQMTRRQTLPSGDQVHHSGLMIPPGLYEFDRDPHSLSRLLFNVVSACAASSLSGVQITMRRRGLAVRIGLPIANLRTFFGDREPDTSRGRRPILHLRRPHLRRIAGGKEIVIHEHLSGQRFLRWRDYDINISIPGIHHAAAEAFIDPTISEEDANFGDLDTANLATIGELGGMFSRHVWKRRKIKFRHGRPTVQYLEHHLDEGP